MWLNGFRISTSSDQLWLVREIDAVQTTTEELEDLKEELTVLWILSEFK